MHVNVRRQTSQRWTRAGVAFVAFVFASIGLEFYGIGWRDPPLIIATRSLFLDALLLLMLAPWGWLLFYALRRRWVLLRGEPLAAEDFSVRAQTGNPFLDPDTPLRKIVGLTLAVLLAALVISVPGTYGGLAKLLHYTARHPGELVATVARKHASPRKGARCAPRLEFDGFRALGDELCVDRAFFDRVEIGDRIRLTGELSPYAMEPKQLELVAASRARQ